MDRPQKKPLDFDGNSDRGRVRVRVRLGLGLGLGRVPSYPAWEDALT